MKKQSTLKKILSVIWKIVVVLFVMLVFALGSFEGVSKYLTGDFYNIKKLFAETKDDLNKEKTEEEEEVDDSELESTVLFVTSQDGTTEYLYLNLVDKDSKALFTLIVPEDAQFNLSSRVLKKVKKKMEDTSSLVKISDVARAFGPDKYDMICEIIGDTTGLNISEYYAMNAEQFKNFMGMAGKVSYHFASDISFRNAKGELVIFEKGYQELGPENGFALISMLDGTANQESNRLERVNQYLNLALPKILHNKKSTEIAKALLDRSVTNTDKKEEDLAKTFKKMKKYDPVIRILQGSETGGVFVIDSQKAQLQISALIKQALGDIRKNKKQDSNNDDDDSENDSASSSKEYSIEIFNAAYVQGIAGAWQEYLEGEGYSISMVDNYRDEGPLSTTRILVTEEGMGKDLLNYFPNAEIRVGEIDTGGSIRIYVGTDSTTPGSYGQ